MKTVFILVGPKGTGKSFIGDLLNRKLGVHFLRVEPIFIENMKTSKLTGKARDEEGFLKVLAEIDSLLSQKDTITIESTGASGFFPSFLDSLRKKYSVRLIAVRTPLNRCLERVKTRDQSIHIPVSDDRVNEINAIASRVQLPWDLEIDNSGPATEESIVLQFETLL